MTYPQFTIYNTYAREKQVFVPVEEGKVKIYVCGLTVYDKSHIGHAHMFTMVDFLVRSLEYIGYDVTMVRNHTDVGHLTSDADEGEDKMEKGAQKVGLDVWELAEQMIGNAEEFFLKLNIRQPDYKPRATKTVDVQIELIFKLIERGYAYVTKEAVYFDVQKFPDYEKYSGQKFEDMITAKREEVKTGEEKKFPADFVLWFFTQGRFADHSMRWDSPWGEGFPGWHIECSAMSYKYLGFPIDIHTGGEDHIKVHHANEIAQSECALGEKFVNYWFHDHHLTVDGRKMSKSLGNVYSLEDIEKKGYDIMDLRYLYGLSHYRKGINFTFEGLTSAQKARENVIKLVKALEHSDDIEIDERYEKEFIQSLSDDLNVPKAIAVLRKLLEDNDLTQNVRYHTALDFDKVLALGLDKLVDTQKVDAEVIQKIVDQRNLARINKDFALSDKLRDELQDKFGVTIIDNDDGSTDWN